MFRNSGSDFVRSLALTAAAVVFSFTLGGCSSSNSTSNDSGTPAVCTQADVDAIFTGNCISCHDASGSYAGLNLTSTGLASRLVGVAPPGGGTSAPSMCTGMGQVYIVKNSNPATGLLLSKIDSANPPCGVRMPYGVGALKASDIACIQSWANTVSSM